MWASHLRGDSGNNNGGGVYQGPHLEMLWVHVEERKGLVKRAMVQLLKGHEMLIIFPQEVLVGLLVGEF